MDVATEVAREERGQDPGPLDLYLVALEGASALLPDLDARLDDPADRDVLLGSLRAIERVPELLGATPHMLAVARRP